jgi:ABC-2 type transport system permease protein
VSAPGASGPGVSGASASGPSVSGRDTSGHVLGAGTPARAASWPAMAAALTIQELRLAVRRGENLLAQFVIPAGTLVVLSALDLGGTASTGQPVDRALPASIALAVIAAALVSLGIATAYERSYGVLKRLGGSPAGTSVLVAAKTAGVAVVEAVQVVLLLAIAAGLLGWSPGAGTNALLVALGLVLGTVAFAGLGLLLAGTLRAEATLAFANLLFVLALAIGGIAVPLDRLPAALGAVAAVLPPAALVQVLGIGLGAAGDAGLPLAILAGWAILLAGLAAWRFRWD